MCSFFKKASLFTAFSIELGGHYTIWNDKNVGHTDNGRFTNGLINGACLSFTLKSLLSLLGQFHALKSIFKRLFIDFLRKEMKTSDIQIRDPYIFVAHNEKTYYMFGTTDHNCWRGPGQGFDCYSSKDLENWDGPIPAFRPSSNFWGKENFWAPEVHLYNDKFYMFASFKAPQHYRGTQILVANDIIGPYTPLTNGPVTPANWQCLDGTLYVDAEGNPWIVFCHEWVQIHNGSICAMRSNLRPEETRGTTNISF